MKRLIQQKDRTNRKSRTPRQKKLPATVMAEPRQDSVVAVVEEEPLPFMMAEMALWGAAMSALMVPIGIATLIASPFAVAGDLWRSRGGVPAAEAAA
jgi:hypothetical protein